MTYTVFDPASPTTAETRQVAIDDTRYNLLAIRDAVIMGNLAGFNYAWSGGTDSQPNYITRTKGTEIIRATITWGATGGATGNPTSIVYEYSPNLTPTYSTIGTCSYTWDASGFLTSTTWS